MTTVFAPSPIHPRMRERLEEVEGEAKRHYNRTLWQLMAISALGVLCAMVLHSPLFDLEQLVVDGWDGDPQALAVASGLEAGEPLVRADLDSARRGIAALPTVDTVSLHRSWNGTIAVEIVERTPAAAFAIDDGQPLLVDADGRILGRGDAAGTVRVSGVTLSGDTSARVAWLDVAGTSTAAVAAEVPDDVAAIVHEMGATPFGYTLQLHNGAVVRLGSAEDLDEKFMSLRTLLLSGDLRCAQLIDIRAAVSPVIDLDTDCL